MPRTISKRRFEYVAGTSDKFWEIHVSGNDVIVRFGRNGTNGQSSTKTFGNEAAATKHAGKLIADNTNKGYVEVG